MTAETLQLLLLTDAEAKVETLKEMREDFYSFEKVGLDGLFAHFLRGEDEV